MTAPQQRSVLSMSGSTVNDVKVTVETMEQYGEMAARLRLMELASAKALEASYRHTRCLACDRDITVGPGARTKRARFCDDACRQKAQRLRNKR